MTTTPATISDGLSVIGSDYQPMLETIAPGISAILVNQRTTGQNWWQTLYQCIGSMTLTIDQQTILMDLADAASAGQPAPKGLIYQGQTIMAESLPAGFNDVYTNPLTQAQQAVKSLDWVKTLSVVAAGLSIAKSIS